MEKDVEKYFNEESDFHATKKVVGIRDSLREF